MVKQCRTCAQIITTNEYFYINGSSLVSSTLRVYDLLLSFVPEFDLSLLPDPAICRNCMSTLHIAYTFKDQITKNEIVFREHCIEESEDLLLHDEIYEEKESTIDVKDHDVQDDCLISKPNEDKDLDSTSDEINAEGFQEKDKDLDSTSDEINAESFQETVDSIQEATTIESYGIWEPQTEEHEVIVDSRTLNAFIDVDYKERRFREVDRPFKCSVCDFASDNKACLIMHNRIHSGEKPFQCTECNYRAKRKSHLEDHVLNIHNQQPPLQCGVCQKLFKNKQNLRKHHRTHTGQKPYRCVQCDFKSGHRNSVINHVKRVHMGFLPPKPRKTCTCEVCGKGFTRPSTLNVHMRIHTNTKQLLCEWCGKHFREVGILKNHLLTHKEKMFKCSKCSYDANRKSHLQQHIQIYGDHNDLYYCNKCSNCYPNTLNLAKHKKEAHAIEESVERNRDDEENS